MVFKEYVDLVRYPGRGEASTNEAQLCFLHAMHLGPDPVGRLAPRHLAAKEWRLWFLGGNLMEVTANSFQEIIGNRLEVWGRWRGNGESQLFFS